MPIVVRGGDRDAVPVQVHVAGEVGELEAVHILVGIGLPENQPATAATATGPHQRAVGQPDQPPEHPLSDALRHLLPFGSPAFQTEEHHQRFMHGAQWIAGFVKPASGQTLAVRGNGQSSHATEIHLLAAVVGVERCSIKLPHFGSRGYIPLPN